MAGLGGTVLLGPLPCRSCRAVVTVERRSVVLHCGCVMHRGGRHPESSESAVLTTTGVYRGDARHECRAA